MTEYWLEWQDGVPTFRRNPLVALSTSEPPPPRVGFGSTTSTQSPHSIIPPAPGGTRFRRVMAWLGLSLPAWVVGIMAVSPVSLRCTTVSVPAEYDRGFAQVAVVCWGVFRAPEQTTSVPSDGLTPPSVPPSPSSWPMGTVTPSEASWVWSEVALR